MSSATRFKYGFTILVIGFALLILFTLFSPDEQWRNKYYYDLCANGCASYQSESKLTTKLGKPDKVLASRSVVPVPADADVFEPTGRGVESPATVPEKVPDGQHLDIYRSPSGRYSLFILIDKTGKDSSEACVAK